MLCLYGDLCDFAFIFFLRCLVAEKVEREKGEEHFKLI